MGLTSTNRSHIHWRWSATFSCAASTCNLATSRSGVVLRPPSAGPGRPRHGPHLLPRHKGPHWTTVDRGVGLVPQNMSEDASVPEAELARGERRLVVGGTLCAFDQPARLEAARPGREVVHRKKAAFGDETHLRGGGRGGA
eukprot:scaffold5625_cov126-Isochrysis_galbana.AAC.5